MVLILIAIFLGSVFLIWLWKGPIKKSAKAMQKSGSSAAEAYIIIVLLAVALAVAVYMIANV